MTDETLKLYTDLQPFFRERMGDWQEFDRGYGRSCLGTVYGTGIVLGREFHYFEPEFRNASFCIDDYHPKVIRLPLLIDPANSERGLWGMIDWTCAFADVSGDGTINIFDTETGESLSDGWQTPEFALLNAIWKQRKKIHDECRHVPEEEEQ